jgi:WD40 repeat protein
MSVDTSPNGKWIASGSLDNTLRIWDISSGALLKTCNVHNNTISSLDWSPDGNRIVTGSWDKTIRIWADLNATPNIRILSISVDRTIFIKGDNVNITVTLVNTGTADGLNTIINLYDYYSLLTSIHMSVYQNESKIFVFRWKIAESIPLGLHVLRVAIPNQEKNVSITIMGIPNVHLVEITADKSNCTLGDTVNIAVKFENNGTAYASKINIILFNENVSLFTRNVNVGIGKMNSTYFSWEITTNISLGKHRLWAKLGESEKSIVLTIIGRPNINIWSIKVDNENITVGQKVIISVTIINNGTGNAIDLEVILYDGNSMLMKKKVNISQGKSSSVDFEWNTSHTTIGIHTLKIVVETSIKETTVKVNKRPNVILNYPISTWLIALLILLIVIISCVLGYSFYKHNKYHS